MQYRHVKKLLISTLTASMLAGTISGCGSSSSNSNSSSIEPASSTSSTSTTSEDESKIDESNNDNSNKNASESSDSQQEEDFVAEGAKYLENMDYDNAILCFEKAIKADSKNAKAYAGLYVVYMAQGNDKNAANVVKDMQSSDTSEKDFLKEALSYAETVLKKGSAEEKKNALKAVNAIGDMALESKNYEFAEKAYKQTLAYDSINTGALSGLYLLYRQQGNTTALNEIISQIKAAGYEVQETTAEDGSLSVLIYDPNGNVVQKISADAEGKQITREEYTYNADGTVASETKYNGNDVAYIIHEYSENKEIIYSGQQTKAYEITHSEIYDMVGMYSGTGMLSEKSYVQFTMENGIPVSAVYYKNGTPSLTFYMDEIGNITKVLNMKSNNTTEVQAGIFKFVFNDQYICTESYLPDFDTGETVHRYYEESKRPEMAYSVQKAEILNADNEIVVEILCTYDRNGLMTQVVRKSFENNQNTRTTVFNYVDEILTDAVSTTYKYDDGIRVTEKVAKILYYEDGESEKEEHDFTYAADGSIVKSQIVYYREDGSYSKTVITKKADDNPDYTVKTINDFDTSGKNPVLQTVTTTDSRNCIVGETVYSVDQINTLEDGTEVYGYSKVWTYKDDKSYSLTTKIYDKNHMLTQEILEVVNNDLLTENCVSNYETDGETLKCSEDLYYREDKSLFQKIVIKKDADSNTVKTTYQYDEAGEIALTRIIETYTESGQLLNKEIRTNDESGFPVKIVTESNYNADGIATLTQTDKYTNRLLTSTYVYSSGDAIGEDIYGSDVYRYATTYSYNADNSVCKTVTIFANQSQVIDELVTSEYAYNSDKTKTITSTITDYAGENTLQKITETYDESDCLVKCITESGYDENGLATLTQTEKYSNHQLLSRYVYSSGDPLEEDIYGGDVYRYATTYSYNADNTISKEVTIFANQSQIIDELETIEYTHYSDSTVNTKTVTITDYNANVILAKEIYTYNYNTEGIETGYDLIMENHYSDGSISSISSGKYDTEDNLQDLYSIIEYMYDGDTCFAVQTTKYQNNVISGYEIESYTIGDSGEVIEVKYTEFDTDIHCLGTKVYANCQYDNQTYSYTGGQLVKEERDYIYNEDGTVASYVQDKYTYDENGNQTVTSAKYDGNDNLIEVITSETSTDSEENQSSVVEETIDSNGAEQIINSEESTESSNEVQSDIVTDSAAQVELKNTTTGTMDVYGNDADPETTEETVASDDTTVSEGNVSVDETAQADEITGEAAE